MKHLCCFLLGLIFTSAQVQTIEPEFWWAGMRNPNLQLMLYGKNIADSKLDSELNIQQIHSTENPNYLFVDVDLNNTKPGKYKITFANSNQQQVFWYEIKPRQKNSNNRKGFDSSDVVYLIMPDRFANGNPVNDSHPEMTEKANRKDIGGRHGGDIQGIINQLDYLQDLGVTALWSTPLCEDNQPTYSYHTYAQTDLYKIDPRYGTNQDYAQLANELHKRDMKLIMDYVTNHWGSQHWMFKDMPSKDWFNYWEGEPNGYRNSEFKATTQFDSNASEVDKKETMDGWFAPAMPDINQRNPFALKYITQNAIWWIEYANLDGLRVDTYIYNNKQAIAKWTKAIMEEYPNFNIVGEAWMYNQAHNAYWQKNSTIAALDNYNSYLPSVMDFTLQEMLTHVFNENPKYPWLREGLTKVYLNFTNDFLYPDINNIMVFAGNHDITRIAEYYNDDFSKFKLVHTILFTIRGIPQIYYGDEIGMMGNKEKVGDGDIRRDFPGGWEADERSAFTKEGRTKREEAYHGFTKKLLNWRKNKSVIHTGKTMQFVPKNNVYVYFRHNESDKIMVIINNAQEQRTVNTTHYQEMLQDATKGIDVLSNQAIKLNQDFTIQPKTSMIIEIK